MVPSSHSLGHSFFRLKLYSCFEMKVNFLRTHIWYLGINCHSGLYFFQAYFNMCWYCSWLFAPILKFYLWNQITNYSAVLRKLSVLWCVCARMHLAEWNVKSTSMKQRWIPAGLQNFMMPQAVTLKAVHCLIKNNSHRNRCSVISQLNCTPMKSTSTCPQARVTILLHGLIEWKILFQSLPRSTATLHQSSSAL